MARQATPNDLLGDVTVADAGLAAMFGPVSFDGERVQQIPVDHLDPNPFQHRTIGLANDDPSLMELSKDIAQHGVIQPLVVRRDPRDTTVYQVAAGHRRLVAARMAGLTTVPCVVRDLDDVAMFDVVFAENYHRTDVNAIDRAQLIALLVEQGLTQKEIADRLSISTPTVSNALRLLRAPEAAQQAAAEGKISERQLAAMAPIFDLPPQAASTVPSWGTANELIRLATGGMSSDNLRERSAQSVNAATRELPDHWRKRQFDEQEGIVQPLCGDCPQTVKLNGKTRCANPTCWDLKSSVWRGIENRAAVEATGVQMEPEKVEYNQRNRFTNHDALALGLPPHGAFTCPNLRLSRHHYGDPLHGAMGLICFNAKGGPCKCLARLNREQAKDGTKLWKVISAQTTEALVGLLSGCDLPILRLWAYQFAGWEDRDKVPSWSIEQCVEQIVSAMIKSRTPYEPHKSADRAREAMEAVLTLAGLRAPWAPLDAESINHRFDEIQVWLDDFMNPGDGLPTPISMRAILDELNQLHDASLGQFETHIAMNLRRRYQSLWPQAIALNDRVERSYSNQPSV